MNRVPHTKENWYATQQITDRIIGIAEWGHTEEVLAFLLLGDQEAAVIDTCCGFFSLKEIVEQLTNLPCKVINTHQHFDHIGNNFEFEQVLMPDHPANRTRAQEGLSAEFCAEFATPEQFWGTIPAGLPEPYSIRPFPHATFFKDGDVLELHPFKLEVLHTPGHCADHCCFFEREMGILFGGDNLYDGPIFIQKQDGLALYRQSIERLCALPNLNLILPSHNGFTFPLEKLHKIQEALSEIKTAELAETVVVDGPLRLMPVPYAA
ncbi:MAG: MBL fold metallo-hydrolase [Chloroflexota bacterium]